MKKISVIIPTYNSQETIATSLESIINQDYSDYEICIVDGNSNDNTINIIQEYCRRFDFIKFLTEKDDGPYDAMNKGIDMSSGEWLLFLGSNDLIYENNTFQKIFTESIPEEIGLLYGSVMILDDIIGLGKAGQIYDGEFNLDKLLQKNICHQSIFYRRSLFKKLGKYNLKYPVCSDWEMNMRFFASTKVYYLDLTVAGFSGGGLSSIGEVKDPIHDELSSLKRKYFLNYLIYRKINRIFNSLFWFRRQNC
ncbi:glycosyltransferase family 2 protein [Crocosphaera sp. XPORK-15E]|uniref:glycosyltransferase family 2 protein n=1 Tax=Crocosphaera sp. XPORK-15E TaxID=3110247 RepID=UPI002B211247|nr:glycosyltransferase family 2 protein [Crocosphaera sp. XPORK-15E]MEA5534791.1 glycosyltransferase family 2 protein [Crocosphaera sp. XPORK-15E]